ncbi:conjugal transfer protein TraC [Desulfolithobacter dissulfuricans]|uniref:Conjugal transfer protein TraC n=1 Tax=Desulfolithobacter dissulfuricans TaxID=2795293 RepID=A0A915U0K4_9BACT|nr:TraC family protein [Desulfolithobacter dissulfuricans]BCO09256.1 conjugal transfer protein TraC [Desulfolithobacter dissulfuricans]
MFIELVRNIVFGKYGGMRFADLDEMTRRQSFSNYLNYVSYDPDTKSYLNQDDTVGLLWECSPITFAGTKTIKTMEGLFRAGLPMDSVIQLILHADPHIDPILDQYKQNRVRKHPLITANTEAIMDFFWKGKKGLEACGNIPVRNFRLFVAVKLPRKSREARGALLKDIQRQITETLHAARLYPRHMEPGELLEWCRRLINHYPKDYPDSNFNAYGPNMPIRKQVITSDTVIRDEGEYLRIGDNYFCCTTPKVFPREVDPLQTNTLFGGIWGVTSDADQIKTGFIYAFNIIFEPLNAKLHAKCNLVLNQEAVGSLSPSLRRKQQEYLTATDELERGVQFVKIMPIMWTYAEDPDLAKDSCARVRRIWENNGYVMQQDQVILKILFLATLPFGLYTAGKNLQNINRDFIAPVTSVTPVLPIQGDFNGAGAPKLLFLGRKGQLASLDFFDTGAVNQNIFCCASSGTGKSFQVNFIAFNYYASGALVRIIDIGGSYKKMANMLGARYLDFHPDIPICLNPFTHIVDPNEELKSVAAVFAQMAYSNSDDAKPDDTEMNLIRNAVRWAWKQKQSQADADTVYEFLLRFPDVPDTELSDLADNKELVEVARKLAFNIREFTSQGAHGRFFTGPSTFDIRNDEFVVLELENLKVQPDLYRVVTLLVINAVTQDLYLSDRSRPRLIIFDEAWQFLGRAAMMASVISEGYRRARKYQGSFMVITQSILDLEAFGEVGDVIRGNSAFKIFLESPDFDAAKKKGLIDYDDFTMNLLKSVKSNPPSYSELFFDTPFGTGVLRLTVNRYAYYIYTSKASEIAQIESMVKDGKTYDEAIREMLRRDKLRDNSGDSSPDTDHINLP